MDRRAGSLFSGVGGLDQAAAEVFDTELAWVSDNDPAASAVLAHRYPDAPNLGDITAVDWGQVEPVWMLTGGSPCQDVSSAGRRAGMYPATRSGLWAHYAYAIKQLRPRYVVFENVRGLSSACAENEMGQCPGCLGDGRPHRPFLRALGRVLGDLADLGYDAVWCGLPAAAVGAPHERFRIFILAHDAAGDAAGLRWDPAQPPHGGRESPWASGGPDCDAPDPAGARRTPVLAGAALGGPGGAADRGGEVQPGGLRRAAADTDSAGLEGAEPAPGHHLPAGSASPDARRRRQRPGQPDLHEGQPDPARRGDARSTAADPHRMGLEPNRPTNELAVPAGSGDWGIYTAAVRRWERVLGRPAPVPRVAGPRGGLKLNPALPEWMQGFPAGWITAVPGVSLNDALKLAGNSVNPFQAAAALRWLAAQLPTPVTPGGTQ